MRKQSLLTTFMFGSLFIFTNLAYAQNSTPEQNAEAKKNTARQVLGPALVTPPDALTDELSPDDNLPSFDEPIETSASEPIPQIKKKKEYIDPRFRPESRFIEHPNASKGLIKIDKDKIYHYRVKHTDQKNAGSFRLGTYEPLNLINPENTTLTYTSLYGDSAPILLLYDQERQFFQKFGKLAWKFGGGLYLANGHGEFAEPNPDPTAIPPEKFTLFVFPLNVGAIYRLHYFKNQWIVPYVEGGLDAFCFGETRDDDQNPSIGAKLGIAPATHFSLGGSISLGKNANSFLDLDREYGINAVYLTFEYRNYISLSDKFDFSGEALTGGITAEY
ncbi:MAG: hypothetical protein KDD38_01575 [Bdellovibrionales bacterium]|nr:hypothetical protein [Bdellovibrionales bacterium]